MILLYLLSFIGYCRPEPLPFHWASSALYVVYSAMYNSFWLLSFLYWVLEMVSFQSQLISHCHFLGLVIPLGDSSPELGRLHGITAGFFLSPCVQMLLVTGSFRVCDGIAFVLYHYISETCVTPLLICYLLGSGFLIPWWH